MGVVTLAWGEARANGDIVGQRQIVDTTITNLEMLEHIWAYLKIFGDIWRRLTTFADSWRNLEAGEDIWGDLET